MDIQLREEWRPVLGWPKYEISNLGNVRGPRGPIKTFVIPSKGKDYVAFNVINGRLPNGRENRKSLRVHREIARAFLGDQPKLLALHGDGNRFNNVLTNIRWGTNKDNEDDKKKHGTSMLGKRHKITVTTPEIRRAVAFSSAPCKEVAAQFGLSNKTVQALRLKARKGLIT